MGLEENVFHTIEQYDMIRSGESVIAGVSGGADSVCLFMCLLAYQKRVPFDLSVVHVNHGIRKEAKKDAAFVKELCGRYEIPCHIYEVDVKALAANMRMSEEEAGRKARYDAFHEEAGRIGREDSRIAVAHHQDDLAETVLFQMFRGSSLRGLAGIKPVNDRIIRPLLYVNRQEIEEYLQKRQMTYCMDATNLTDEYTRNKIRHHILPFARENINARVVAHIAALARQASQADSFFEKRARAFVEKYRISEENSGKDSIKIGLPVDKLLELEPIELRYVLYTCIGLALGRKKDITQKHVENIEAILTLDGSKELHLPFGLLVKKVYDRLYFEPSEQGVQQKQLMQPELSLDGSFEMRKFFREKNSRIVEKKYTKWFDYDKIYSECVCTNEQLCARYRQANDTLQIDAEGHNKTLKKYMIDEKIPKDERDKLPVLAIGSSIVWIPGYRMSARYQVTEQTSNILEIHFKEEENHG